VGTSRCRPRGTEPPTDQARLGLVPLPRGPLQPINFCGLPLPRDRHCCPYSLNPFSSKLPGGVGDEGVREVPVSEMETRKTMTSSMEV